MIVSKKHYDYLRNKFDLLTNELVKANIDLSNNINFVSYMKTQDVQDILWGEAEKIQYEDIVKALIKTIKFYEQADHKLDSAVNYALSDCNECLKDNLTFKNHLRDFISTGMDHREAIARALYFTIVTINKKVDSLQDLSVSLMKENDKLEEQVKGEQVEREDAEQTCDRLASYIAKLERENEQLKNDIEYQERKNDKLTDANLKQFSTIQERNNEIDALKHMLDRKDND